MGFPLPSDEPDASSWWPRFRNWRRRWALKAPITVSGLKDLVLDPERVGLKGSPTEVAGTKEAARRQRRREMLCGDPLDKARALIAH